MAITDTEVIRFQPVTRRQYNVMEKMRERLGLVTSGFKLERLLTLWPTDPWFNSILAGEWEAEIIKQNLFQRARENKVNLSWAEGIKLLKHVAVFCDVKAKPQIKEMQ